MDDTTQLIFDEFKERGDKSIDHLKERLSQIRTGRATPALLDGIRVEAYGVPTPLNQLAHVSVPEARQLMIKPFDLSVMSEIEKAIHQSNLGLAPQGDGKVLRLTLPPLSEEQRKKLVVKVKEFCEQARVALRNERRDANKHADQYLKDNEITEDFHRELHDAIDSSIKEFEGQVDAVFKRKTDEVMND